jgi:hypothetical protein
LQALTVKIAGTGSGEGVEDDEFMRGVRKAGVFAKITEVASPNPVPATDEYPVSG